MKRLLFGTLLLLLSGGQLASAQTDDFYIRQTITGNDTTPPTTPTLLSATPVAASQIDIAWTASTDDQLLSGYSILRDGTPIATTTLLSYSDTGLTASTTYSYAVRAFDYFINYSTTSNSIATTTLDNPPPPVTPTSTTESTESTAARVVLRDLVITPGVSTTSLELITARPSRIEFRWGRSASYELGYVVSGVYKRDYSTMITDLEPGTTYEYEIIGYGPRGRGEVLETGVFTTLVEQEVKVSPNVSLFQAVGQFDDVELSWKLPAGDLSHVRVVRSHLGFPQHLQDGAIVYQGLGEYAQDEGVLKQYSPVYYTAFVVDKYGTVSSGAIAIVYAADDRPVVVPGGESGGSTGFPGETITGSNQPTSSINTERVEVGMKMPELDEILILQGNKSYDLTDRDIKLESKTPFTISIPKRAVAGNLKSIIASVVDPANPDKKYSFLLRINSDQSAYEAVVDPLEEVGDSWIGVEIYDYEAYVVGSYQAPVEFVVPAPVKEDTVVFPDLIVEKAAFWLPISLLLLLLIVSTWWFIAWRRRNEDNS